MKMENKRFIVWQQLATGEPGHGANDGKLANCQCFMDFTKKNNEGVDDAETQ